MKRQELLNAGMALAATVLLGGCAHVGDTLQAAVEGTLSTLAELTDFEHKRTAAPGGSPPTLSSDVGGWPPPEWQRPFFVGFTPIPRQPPSTESWLETWDELLKRHADFVLHHVKIDWTAFVDGPDAASFSELEGLKWVSGMAVRDQLDVFYVVDPLRPDREQMDPALPASLGRRFADESVRRAFKHCATPPSR
jgi:hypothetical protein